LSPGIRKLIRKMMVESRMVVFLLAFLLFEYHAPLQKPRIFFQEVPCRKNQRHEKDPGNHGRIRTGDAESY
jgi:hypothetical protein